MNLVITPTSKTKRLKYGNHRNDHAVNLPPPPSPPVSFLVRHTPLLLHLLCNWYYWLVGVEGNIYTSSMEGYWKFRQEWKILSLTGISRGLGGSLTNNPPGRCNDMVWNVAMVFMKSSSAIILCPTKRPLCHQVVQEQKRSFRACYSWIYLSHLFPVFCYPHSFLHPFSWHRKSNERSHQMSA